MKKLILVFMAAVAISCGDNKKEEKPGIQIGTQVEEKAAPAETTDDTVANITIEGNDQMKFNKSEIRVKAGQKVVLTLKHVGTMDVTVMGHNWALLTQDADMAAVGQAAASAKDSDYIPTDMTDKIIAHTKMLGGGETDTIEFDAPAPGTYTFMCTFPGHYALMQGKFIVE
ncbi:azurin [Aequorivita marisscotiae]|uniref:Azurin n=1 Tax=Aequorivita marisscotiae TaxID=3040348 RepID=A0ABY8KWC8_9FLAO|nr:azurin [Aequorivita sp. Ant34-E75]WGF92167.1 azurin [Aequorivita sp. Ant34-E75]